MSPKIELRPCSCSATEPTPHIRIPIIGDIILLICLVCKKILRVKGNQNERQ